AAGLAQLQGRSCSGIDESLFHRGLGGPVLLDEFGKPGEQQRQPFGKTYPDRWSYGAAGDELQAIAGTDGNAPAAASQPRVDADDSHCFHHERPLGQALDPTKSFVNETETSRRLEV